MVVFQALSSSITEWDEAHEQVLCVLQECRQQTLTIKLALAFFFLLGEQSVVASPEKS